MKFAVRILALSFVIAGVAAAATTPKASPAIPSHQSATASLPRPDTTFPIPACGPRKPGGCIVNRALSN